MLFNNLAFFARFGFFRRGLAFFSKGVWQPSGCQHSYSQRQRLLYGFRSTVNDRFATNQNDISLEARTIIAL